jgi:hypothetical protein
MKLHSRIISLFLSFWMLVVSTGFSLSFHYCGGKLENWSILNDSSSCAHHQEEEKKSCCLDEIETKIDNSCCKSSEKKILLKEDFNLNSFNFTFSNFALASTLFIVTNTLQTNASFEEYFKTKHASPRIMIEDIPIFIQSFLI